MYANNKKILALLLFLIVGEGITMGIVFGIPNQILIGIRRLVMLRKAWDVT